MVTWGHSFIRCWLWAKCVDYFHSHNNSVRKVATPILPNRTLRLGGYILAYEAIARRCWHLGLWSSCLSYPQRHHHHPQHREHKCFPLVHSEHSLGDTCIAICLFETCLQNGTSRGARQVLCLPLLFSASSFNLIMWPGSPPASPHRVNLMSHLLSTCPACFPNNQIPTQIHPFCPFRAL